MKNINKEIKVETKSLREQIVLLKKDISKLEVDWNSLSDFDSSCDNIHNSIVWLLALKETQELNEKKKKAQMETDGGNSSDATPKDASVRDLIKQGLSKFS